MNPRNIVLALFSKLRFVSLSSPGTTVINVASYKNVDEEALLKIDGVNWVPAVGKVTIAMLERNLLRLYALQQARM